MFEPLKNYVVSFEDWNKANLNRNWGGEIPNKAIRGDIAYQKSRNSKGKYKIAGGEKLLKECYYIFRYSKDGTKLIPLRVSMHPKTQSNIEKGSIRYGSLSIIREL